MSNPQSGTPWQIQVFFDGECPLCDREIKVLRWLDRGQRILFTDIAASGFSAKHYGLTQDEFMAEIRGQVARWQLDFRSRGFSSPVRCRRISSGGRRDSTSRSFPLARPRIPDLRSESSTTHRKMQCEDMLNYLDARSPTLTLKFSNQ